jgi:hypothetical protein
MTSRWLSSRSDDQRPLVAGLHEAFPISARSPEGQLNEVLDIGDEGLAHPRPSELHRNLIRGPVTGEASIEVPDLPTSEVLYTVMSNTSGGAWPLVELLDELLPELARA